MSGDGSGGEVERMRAALRRTRAELDASRAELDTVRAGGAGRRRSRLSVRSLASASALALAALLAPLSVVAAWTADLVGDTDRYVETVAPLATDPSVQDAVAAEITDQVFRHVHVTEVTDRLVTALDTGTELPPAAVRGLRALEQPLADGVRSFVDDTVHDLVSGPAFADAWARANRLAHEQVVGALTGRTPPGSAVTVTDGRVVVDLSALIDAVRKRLSARGFTLVESVPAVPVTITIVESPELARVQDALGALDTLAAWLPVLAIAMLVTGVLLAGDRRRALAAGAVAVVGTMLLLGVALAVLRHGYLSGVEGDTLPRTAAASVFDTLVRFLRTAARTTALAALVVAVAAFFAGPSSGAQHARAGVTGSVDAVRRGLAGAGLRTGPVGTWLARHRTATRTGVLASAALAYLAFDRPTPRSVMTTVVATVGVLLVLELSAAPGRPGAAVPDETSAVPGPPGR